MCLLLEERKEVIHRRFSVSKMDDALQPCLPQPLENAHFFAFFEATHVTFRGLVRAYDLLTIRPESELCG